MTITKRSNIKNKNIPSFVTKSMLFQNELNDIDDDDVDISKR
jgi:hypothetical protein